MLRLAVISNINCFESIVSLTLDRFRNIIWQTGITLAIDLLFSFDTSLRFEYPRPYLISIISHALSNRVVQSQT